MTHSNNIYFPEVSIVNNKFAVRESLFKSAIQRSAYTVIGNSVGKEQLCKYYGMASEQIKINSLAVLGYVFSLNADDSIIAHNNLSDNKYLFFPAQFWAHKNHIRLLKAMVHLKENGFKMVFTGSDQGNAEYIKKKIAEFGLENDVLLLGFVTKNELIALYIQHFFSHLIYSVIFV